MLTFVFLVSAIIAVGTTGATTVYAFNEKNNNFVSNTHNHLRIGDPEGGPEEIQSNSGGSYNDEDTHSSNNYNSERGENTGNYQKDNTHSKPNNNK